MRDGNTLFKQEEDKQTSKSWLFLEQKLYRI